MKIKNQNTIPSKYLLLIVVVVCGILLGAERFMDGGPLSWVANYTIIPMQKGISYVGTWMSDLTDNFATLKDLQKENEELQERIDTLTIDNTRLRQEQYELERLQELYKLDQNYADYEKVGAHVIANNGTNWFSSFTIDKGSNDGIRKDMNVLAGSGLVGIVTDVGPIMHRFVPLSTMEVMSAVWFFPLPTSVWYAVICSLWKTAGSALKNFPTMITRSRWESRL